MHMFALFSINLNRTPLGNSSLGIFSHTTMQNFSTINIGPNIESKSICIKLGDKWVNPQPKTAKQSAKYIQLLSNNSARGENKQRISLTLFYKRKFLRQQTVSKIILHKNHFTLNTSFFHIFHVKKTFDLSMCATDLLVEYPQLIWSNMHFPSDVIYILSWSADWNYFLSL